MTSPRIISLIASATEIVEAMGYGRALVGRSHECDYPGWVAELPVCTASKVKTQASSAEIDRQVKNIVRDALSVYRVDEAALRALRPTHIVTQDQCDVCAVSLKDVEEVLGSWMDPAPQVVTLRPMGLDDVFKDFERVADAIGDVEAGRRLIVEVRNRIADVERRATVINEQPSIACIEWIEPLMAAGNWIPELVATAGGRNLFGSPGVHSPWFSFEDLSGADADVIVVMPCGFDMERTRSEMGPLVNTEGWNDLEAVKSGRVFLVDGNQYFNRPGPRLADSVEILAEIFHPGIFDFGHKGKGWEPL